MNRHLSLAGLALAAVVVAAACSTAAGGGAPGSQPPAPSTPASPVVTPAPSPTVDPTPVRTPDPTSVPTPIVTPAPSGPLKVALENETNHDVTIEMIDEADHVVSARSGHPAEGASVADGTLEAKNLDAKTVQFTWSDLAGDAELGLYVSKDAKVVLVIRPDRPGGDTMAHDRVLVVEFDVPVDASKLVLGVQEGLDTAG